MACKCSAPYWYFLLEKAVFVPLWHVYQRNKKEKQGLWKGFHFSSPDGILSYRERPAANDCSQSRQTGNTRGAVQAFSWPYRNNTQRTDIITDSHLFITVIAYHLLNTIQVKLHESGINMRWKRIRSLLSTHVIITISMTTKDSGRIHVRGCSEPEPFHRRVYSALKIKLIPVMSRLINMWNY